MATVKDLVALIEGEVGNTSGKKYWDYYWKGSWAYVDGYTTPYCACFVTWALGTLGIRCEGYPSACAFDGRWQANGRRVEAYDLQPGDVINFDWGNDGSGDHVGFVEERLDAGYYQTIEGNASNAVRRCWRDASVILYGIRPYYDSEDEVTEADKRDIARYCAEYVFGESDTKANLNMYNTAHWTFGYVKNLSAKVDKLTSLVKQLAKQL